MVGEEGIEPVHVNDNRFTAGRSPREHLALNGGPSGSSTHPSPSSAGALVSTRASGPIKWWSRAESNRRHAGFQPTALPLSYSTMVPKGGFEPPRPKTPASETGAPTNSATWALNTAVVRGSTSGCQNRTPRRSFLGRGAWREEGLSAQTHRAKPKKAQGGIRAGQREDHDDSDRRLPTQTT